MTQVQRSKWNKSHPGSSEILPGSLEKDMVENHIHDEVCFDIPDAKISSLHKKFPPTVSISLQRGQKSCDGLVRLLSQYDERQQSL